MIDIDLNLLRVSGRDWVHLVRSPIRKSRRQPFDAAPRSLDRLAREDQTRQCPSRLGNRCRGILRDDLAYATRVRARSTLRSDDESPRPSMRDLIEEASRLFSDALTLEFDEPSKF